MDNLAHKMVHTFEKMDAINPVELQDHVKLHKNTSGSVTNARSRCPKVLQLTLRNSSIGSLIPHSLQ
jgi:hypothetical protein